MAGCIEQGSVSDIALFATIQYYSCNSGGLLGAASAITIATTARPEQLIQHMSTGNNESFL